MKLFMLDSMGILPLGVRAIMLFIINVSDATREALLLFFSWKSMREN